MTLHPGNQSLLFRFPFRKQPQDFVIPDFRFLLATYAVFPQSHRHSHTTDFLTRSSVGRRTESLPNRCPVRSKTLSRPCAFIISLCRHPQDCVVPFFRLLLGARTVLPQSHLHSHRILPFCRFWLMAITVRRPKRCPTISCIAFTLC